MSKGQSVPMRGEVNDVSTYIISFVSLVFFGVEHRHALLARAAATTIGSAVACGARHPIAFAGLPDPLTGHNVLRNHRAVGAPWQVDVTRQRRVFTRVFLVRLGEFPGEREPANSAYQQRKQASADAQDVLCTVQRKKVRDSAKSKPTRCMAFEKTYDEQQGAAFRPRTDHAENGQRHDKRADRNEHDRCIKHAAWRSDRQSSYIGVQGEA